MVPATKGVVFAKGVVAVAVAYHTMLAPCGCKEAMVWLVPEHKVWVVWVTVGGAIS